MDMEPGTTEGEGVVNTGTVSSCQQTATGDHNTLIQNVGGQINIITHQQREEGRITSAQRDKAIKDAVVKEWKRVVRRFK